ncbi:hypothetical protein K439DRAFT_278193 [Ramaria rubella]|nr:hypothetical protein K439DRAFT_278193 [Ramaria rubella]
MPYDEEKVRSIIRDGTNPRSKPSSQQVRAISSLSYDSGALRIMKRMLLRRLDPKAYVVPETEHTMLMLRSCLSTASQDFVIFVRRDLSPLIARFLSKKDHGDLHGLHKVARSLLRILRPDEVPVEAERPDIHVRTDGIPHTKAKKKDADGVIPSSTMTETPPTTPPDTPNLRSQRDQTVDNVVELPDTNATALSSGTIEYTGLPTPRSSFFGASSTISYASGAGVIDNHLAHIEDRLRYMTSNTPPAITTAQLEAAADMTYELAELEVVGSVIDARLDAVKSQQTYHHLVKTLSLVHYCLFHGSDEFVDFSRERRKVLESLSTLRYLNYDVRSSVEAVLGWLKDERRQALQKERHSRKSLAKQRRTSTTSADFRRLLHRRPSSPSPKTAAKRVSLIESATTTPIVEKIGDHAAGKGGYSDVWKGRLTLDGGVTFILVAVKVLRLTSRAAEPERLRKVTSQTGVAFVSSDLSLV